ncbi:Cullin repeat-containing protein [Rhizopus microsporus var. microsporus]|uniref:Cullin repeat-containing protein n=1 Tax=Rhizopus microsporus var. microsporus TaxID=86635 RepID=A0A1X0QMH4_RHIZD|nr:Cullin repeat-containing protein [Rhizopus microsporus var. microsporus]
MKNHSTLSDRTITVHNLRLHKPQLSTEYEHNAWSTLKQAIKAIKCQECPQESLEILYQSCECLCQYDKAQELYDLLHMECLELVQNQCHELSRNEHDYLNKVNAIWRSYCDQVSQIKSLFLYLDRTFSLNAKGGSIWAMSMDLLRSSFLEHEQIRQKMLSSILELIRMERMSEEIDVPLLQSIIRMLLDLNLYHTEFEPGLLVTTREFYKAEGDSLISSSPMGDYLDHVSTRVHQESILRVKRYFDKSTKAPLQAIVEEELLTKRVTDILDRCFSYFHENYLVDELSLLYRLLKKVGQLDICAKYFINYVKTKGSSILCDRLPVQEKMNILSTFKKKNEYIVDHSFEGDKRFVDGLKDGTGYFINLKENNVVRLLAKHVDNVLKSEKFDEKQLDQCIFAFHHLQSKDVFEALYKKDLAKRLLLDTTNKSGEKVMLAKMKKECGAAYTSKLEGMIRDIKQSNEMMQEFNIEDIYTEFYMQKYPRRRLTWQNPLGVCEVYANYPKVWCIYIHLYI